MTSTPQYPTRPTNQKSGIPLPTWLKDLMGGAIGGFVGYALFAWFLKYGFYAMIAPGGLIGVGASLYKHSSRALPYVTGIAALLISFVAEWREHHWMNDTSLQYFVAHLSDLTPVFWLMMLAGTALGFYLPNAQYRKASP